MSRTPAAPWRNRVTGSGTLKVAEARSTPINGVPTRAAQQAALAGGAWKRSAGSGRPSSRSARATCSMGVCRLTPRRASRRERGALYLRRRLRRGRAPDFGEPRPDRCYGLSRRRQAPGAAVLHPDSEDEQMRALVEAIARQERIELPVDGQAWSIPTTCPSCRPSRSAVSATSGCAAATAYCAATPQARRT